jgi:hypothetical protein
MLVYVREQKMKRLNECSQCKHKTGCFLVYTQPMFCSFELAKPKRLQDMTMDELYAIARKSK